MAAGRVKVKLDGQAAPEGQAIGLYNAVQYVAGRRPTGTVVGTPSIVQPDGSVTFTEGVVAGRRYLIYWTKLGSEWNVFVTADEAANPEPAPAPAQPFRERRRSLRRVVSGTSYL